ncbi:MAG: AAA family ATPase [Candidatus Pacebacteria bacterium]|jgi:dephospho-CoA kinase|nr:AAA family ATPase [Candidatus Paceibacterota bacterium]
MLKIGITGTNGAGKTTFAKYLAGKGFVKLSLSDVIRNEAETRGMELSRRNLQDLGNEMRKTLGLDVLARRAMEKMASGKRYVIDSIRNPEEIRALAEADEFVMVRVEAPVEVRYARFLAQKAPGEELRSLEDFKRSEARELASRDIANQQLEECAAMADFVLVNDSDRKFFFKKIDELLAGLAQNRI